jgi:hypothetical protein
MLYQGVEGPAGTFGVQQYLRTVIGLGTSRDGVHWEFDTEPVLSWEHMTRIDAKLDPSTTVGVIEPAVLVAEGRARMWFVYDHATFPEHALFYAESTDLRHWEIHRTPTLLGREMGAVNRLHYPHVCAASDGLTLWFTLKNAVNEADGIFVATSADGMKWSGARRVLPPPTRGAGIELVAPVAPRLDAIPGTLLRRVANAALRRIYWRAHDWRGGRSRALFGYAHPHLVPVENGQRLYFHYCNEARGEKWLDIGCVLLTPQGDLRDERIIFTPSADPRAWDHVFVADPFVLAL